jgi:hypothetical protein
MERILTGEGEKTLAACADINEIKQCSDLEVREFAMVANHTQVNKVVPPDEFVE